MPPCPAALRRKRRLHRRQRQKQVPQPRHMLGKVHWNWPDSRERAERAQLSPVGPRRSCPRSNWRGNRERLGHHRVLQLLQRRWLRRRNRARSCPPWNSRGNRELPKQRQQQLAPPKPTRRWSLRSQHLQNWLQRLIRPACRRSNWPAGRVLRNETDRPRYFPRTFARRVTLARSNSSGRR